MNIFVTGASGFVGLSLIEDLVQQQHQVYGLIRRKNAAEQLHELGAIPILGDLRTIDPFINKLKGMDAVIHLGAIIKFSGDMDSFYQVNVESTRQLIQAAIEQGVKKFIYVSAAAIALDGRKLTDITEDYNPVKRINSNYLRSKSQAENEILRHKDHIQVIILRPPVIWGPGMRIMEDFRPTIKKMGFPTIGDKHHHIATCHVKNLNVAIIQSLKREKAEGIFLVGDGEKVKMKYFMNELIKAYGMDMGNMHIPKSLAMIMARFLEFVWELFHFKGDPPMTILIVHLMGTEFTLNDAKIRRELGYKNVMSVEEGLRILNNEKTAS